MPRKANEILLELKAENKVLRKKLDEAKHDIDGLTKKVKSSGQAQGSIFKRLGQMAIAYFSVRSVKALTDLAGEITSIEGSFDNLAASAEGGANGLLKAMQTASKGTVDNLSIMRSANLAFQLMGQDVAQHLPKMMEVATAAARSQGKKVADMFNDIVVASGRRSIMILDNLGISSAVAAKYQDEFAKSLGKTRAQLNDTEKSQAFFYAVMKAGGETIKSVGNEGLTFGEKLQILEAQTKNAAQSFTKGLIPALDNLLGVWFNVQQRLGEGESLFSASTWGKSFALVIARITYQFEKLMMVWDQVKNSAGVLRKAFDNFSNKSWGKVWEDLKKGASEARQANIKLATDLDMKYKKLFNDIVQGNYKRVQDEQRTQQGITQATADGLAQRKLLEAQAKYEEYVGEFESAELIKKQIEYQEMLALKTAYQKDEQKIKKAYEKKILIAENEARKKRLDADTAYFKAKLGMMSIEWQTLQEMTAKSSTLMSSNNKYLFKLGKALAYAKAIMNASEAVTKAWAQGGIYGAALAAITAAATAVQIGKIKSTKMPTYKRGRVPVLASGYVPEDHFPAYIGAKEAVMTKEATVANADVLAAMNKTGQRIGTGDTIVNQNNNFSGNVMTRDFIRDQVISELETQARYMGKELFAEKR